MKKTNKNHLSSLAVPSPRLRLKIRSQSVLRTSATAGLAAALIGTGAEAFAASVYFDTSATSGLTPGTAQWDVGTTAAWATSSSPGTTAPVVWANGNDAYFQTAGVNTVTISGTVIANTLTQTTNSTATTITGGLLQINAAGGIVNSGNSALTINSAITLNNASATTYTFNAGNTISIGGAIGQSGATQSISKIGASTLTLSGTNTFTGNMTVSAGTLTLSGSNAYTGATTISGGALTLDFTNQSTNIINSASALNLVGTVTLLGKSGASDSQTFNGTTLALGSSTITATQNGATNLNLALGAISRTTGSVVNLTLPTTGGISTTSSNGSANILGAWITSGGTDWVSNNGTKLVAATYTNDTWASTNDTTVTASSAPSANATTNSLRFNNAGAYTVTLSGSNTLASGGILVSSNVGNNASTITGGTLGVSTPELVVTQNNSSNSLTISSAIVDGTSATGLTKAGSGTLKLGGSDSFSGPLTVLTGTLDLNGSNLSVGTLNVVSGGITDNSVGSGTTTLTTNIATSGTLFGSISNGTSKTLSLTKNGAGILTLKTAQGLTGLVTINQGMINNGGNGEAFGTNTSMFIAASGTWSLGGAGPTIASLSGSGTITDTNAYWHDTLTIGGANATSTFAGAITGGAENVAGNRIHIAKTGNGVLTLTGSNRYYGITTVNAGALVFTGSTANCTGYIVNSGTLAADLTSSSNGILTATAPLTLGSVLSIKGAPNGASTQTLGAVTLNAASSSQILLDPNNATGTSLILGNTWTRNAGANLFIDYSSANTGTRTVKTTSAIAGSGAAANGMLSYVLVKDSSGGYGFGVQDAGFNIVRYDDTTGTTLADTSNSPTTNFTTLNSLFPSGTLSWSNGLTTRSVYTLTIDTTNNGGTIDMGAATNVLTLASGAVLFRGANALTLTGGQLGASGTDTTVHQAGSAALTVASIIGGGAGTLTKDGPGTLILTAANTYTGTTTIGSGTLQIAGAGSLTAGTYAASIIDNGTLAFNTSVSHVLTGVISGNGAVLLQGPGSLTLKGANTFSGGLTVASGTTVFGNSSAALGTGAVQLGNLSGSTARLDFQGFSAHLTYTNPLTVVGTGSNTLSNTAWMLTYNGPITLANANLTLLQATTATTTIGGGISGTGNLIFNQTTNGGFTVQTNPITTTGDVTFNQTANSAIVTVTSLLNNTGKVYNVGSGNGATTLGNIGSNVTGIVQNSTNSGLVLTGTTSYSGTTSVLAGSLTFGTGAITGPIVMSNSTTLTWGTGSSSDIGSQLQTASGNTITLNTNSNNVSLSTFLNGVNANVVKSGAGVLTLAQNNNLGTSGTMTISGGAVNLSASNALVNATVNLNTSLALTYSPAISAYSIGGLAGYYVVNLLDTGGVNNVTLNIGGNNSSSTFASYFLAPGAGTAGAIVKSGTGTLTLSGSSSYSGGTTVNNGTLSISNAGALGSGPVAVNANATLNLTASGITYLFGAVTGSGTIQAAPGAAWYYGIAFTGGLSGFTGTLNINGGGGKLMLTSSSQALGSSATVSVQPNNTLYVATAAPVSAALTLGGGITGEALGQLRLDNGATYAGPITLTGDMTAGSYTIGSASGGGTISGSIGESGGSRGLSKGGSSIVTLSGSNSYSGITNIAAGTLVANHAQALGAGGDITFSGGTLQFTKLSAGEDWSGRIKNSTSAVSLDINGQSLTLAGGMDGSNSAGLSIINSSVSSGTVSLVSANVYGGATSITNGMLKLDFSAGTAPTNDIVPYGSALTLNTASLAMVSSASGGASQTIGGLTLTGPTAISLDPNGGSGIYLNVGNIWTRNAGASLFVDYSSAKSGDRQIAVAGPIIGSGAPVQGILGYALVKDITGAYGFGTQDAFNNVARHDDTLDTTLTDSTNDSTANITTLGAAYTSGTLSWTNGLTTRSVNALTIDATTTGGTIDLGASTNVLSLTSGGLLFKGGSNVTLTGGQLGASGTDLFIHQAGSGILTISSLISGSTGNLSKDGPGTLVLTASNSYTGTTSVSGGTLLLQGSSKTSALTLASGGVLELNAGAAAVAFTNTNGVTFQGVGTIRKTGTGIETLGSNSANYKLGAGSLIDIEAGSYAGGSFSNKTWTNNKSGLYVNTGATFSTSEASVYSDAVTGGGTIAIGYSGGGGTLTMGVADGSGDFSGQLKNGSGTGVITKTGAGTQILSGSNIYTGSTTISSGTLQLGNGGSTGSLSVSSTIANNATLAFDRNNTVVQGTDFTASSIAGTGGVIQAGTGLLAFTSTNGYTGATTIASGTLALGNGGTAGSIPSSSAIVNNGTILFNRTNTLRQGTDFPTISGLGQVVQGGSGLTVLSNSNSHTGGTTVTSGTLQLGNANALGTGGLTVNGGILDMHGNSASIQALGGVGGVITNSGTAKSTLAATFSGTSTYNGNISDGAGGVSVSKGGSGTLVLGGTLSVGGLSANSGVVQLTRSGTVGAISIGATGTILLSANGVNSAKVLDTSALSIATGGTLDLWDNAMIVRDQTSGINQGAHLSTIQGLVNTAFDNGNWDKPGITSSTVVADLGAYSVLTVMVYDNTVLGIDSFEGISNLTIDNGGNQVMLKTTYLGDFDGNGIVNSADYGWLDFYYGYGLTVGDLNGDGQVNSADYNGIDYGYGYQAYGVMAAGGGAVPSAANAATVAASASLEAVPEPGSLGMTLGGLAMLGLGRRLRRSPR